jgi:hypothetical protein
MDGSEAKGESAMAQSQQPEQDGQAEFVRQIVTDPRNVPDVMRLYGYPGASSEDNHDRLYLNPELSSYVEVPQSAILHRMAVPPEQDPHGGVVLWVRRDAALIQKAAPAAQALAHYFAGAIAGAAAAGPVPQPWAAQYVAGAAAAAPGAAAAAIATVQPLLAGGVAQLACTAVCAATAGVNCTNACGTPACSAACTPACAASAACATPACPRTPVCPTVHTPTLCVGVLGCSPDCPTHVDVCPVTPVAACGFGQAGVAPLAAAAAPQAAAFAPAGQLPIGLHTRAIVSCVFACFTQICRTPQPTPCPGCF